MIGSDVIELEYATVTHVIERDAAPDGEFVLVRPDGYTGYRARSNRLDLLRALLPERGVASLPVE